MVKKVQGKGKAKSSTKGAAKGRRSKKNESYAYDEDEVSNKMRAFGEDFDDNDSDGGVAVKDDESVSDDGSDIGWDTDDEIAFGTAVNKAKGKGKEEEVPEDDESDSDKEGGMLLSDMLKGTVSAPSKSVSSKNDEEDEETRKTRKTRKTRIAKVKMTMMTRSWRRCTTAFSPPSTSMPTRVRATRAQCESEPTSTRVFVW